MIYAGRVEGWRVERFYLRRFLTTRIKTTFLFGRQDVLDVLSVDLLPRRHNNKILAERASETKIERATFQI
jgi:hypothetical protein